jgi:hypothetical protein
MEFTGKYSNEIWPQVHEYLAELKEPLQYTHYKWWKWVCKMVVHEVTILPMQNCLYFDKAKTFQNFRKLLELLVFHGRPWPFLRTVKMDSIWQWKIPPINDHDDGISSNENIKCRQFCWKYNFPCLPNTTSAWNKSERILRRFSPKYISVVKLMYSSRAFQWMVMSSTATSGETQESYLNLPEAAPVAGSIVQVEVFAGFFYTRRRRWSRKNMGFSNMCKYRWEYSSCDYLETTAQLHAFRLDTL